MFFTQRCTIDIPWVTVGLLTLKVYLNVIHCETLHAPFPANALDDGAEEGEVPPGGRLQLPVRRLLQRPADCPTQFRTRLVQGAQTRLQGHLQ